MSEKTEAESAEVSMQELLTGIGKLVYKVNESVLGLDRRLESMEAGVASLLKDGLGGVTSELAKANELLSGIREDIENSGGKLVQTLQDSDRNPVDGELFTSTLNDVSVTISESTKSIQETLSEAFEKSNSGTAAAISANTETMAERLQEILSEMGSAREKVENRLEEMSKKTVEEVAGIEQRVREGTESQAERLEEMRELLSLHSVEVRDNRVMELNRSAIVHFNNAEYDRAMTEIRDALELSPESPELLANMAHIEASLGELEEAEGHFRKALEIDPGLEPAISGLGTVLVISGRPGDTIDFLEKHLEEGSDASTGAMIALSRAYASVENHSKALSMLERAEKAAPGHPELERELARYRD